MSAGIGSALSPAFPSTVWPLGLILSLTMSTFDGQHQSFECRLVCQALDELLGVNSFLLNPQCPCCLWFSSYQQEVETRGVTRGVHDTPGCLGTPSWGPGHCWEEGRRLVDQATEQNKLLFPLRGGERRLTCVIGGCSGHPGLRLLPLVLPSLRGKGLLTSPLAAAGTAGRPPWPASSWFAKR